MHIIEKKCLIDLFDMLNEKFEYIVMRNADELPYDNYSNDIDILINKETYPLFETEIKNIFVKHGFNRLESTSFFGIECYTFYNIQNNTPYSLKIDLFFNIEGGGVRYYDFKDISKYRTKNSNGIFIFEPKVEAFLTALKTFAAGGKLKAKYLDLFLNNSLPLNHELYDKCKSITLKKYLKFVYNHKKNPQVINRRSIVLETFKSNFRTIKFKAIFQVFQHYNIEFFRMFKKQYMIVLVGPDGSGKTTMINKLLEDSKIVLRSIPERITIFHHRPHLMPNISDILKKELSDTETEKRNFNPHSGHVSSRLVSFIKLLYYSLDYRLGYYTKISPLQRENKFIVFDRYYYDFIVDQERSALQVSSKIALGVYNYIIPKPNKVFFIMVDADEAHKRKQELPIKTIQKINRKYEQLAKQFKYFKIVPNENIKESYRLFLNSFIEAITEEV